MSIIRRKRETWTTIPNEILGDDNLTLDGLGMLVYMLSKPDNWEFSQERLGERFKKGRDAMRSIMRNLQDCGYVRRELSRDDKGHIRTITIVSETAVQSNREAGKPAVGRPSVGEPAPLVMTETPVNTEQLTLCDLLPQTTSEQPAKKQSDCPIQQIVDAYHEVLDMLPSIRELTDARKKIITKRWYERKKAGKYQSIEDGLKYWTGYFEFVSKSDFLTGRESNFKANLFWILKPENFVKIIEKNYHKDQAQ